MVSSQKRSSPLSPSLTEGCSIRSIVRMTGVYKKTIMKLLVEVASRCQQIMDEKIRGARFDAVECDEIWTFVQKNEGVMKADERKANPELGDQYTYTATALDPVSKMIPTFHVGKRDSVNTHHFIEDLSRRIEGSTQRAGMRRLASQEVRLQKCSASPITARSVRPMWNGRI